MIIISTSYQLNCMQLLPLLPAACSICNTVGDLNMYKAFRKFGIGPLSSAAAVQGHPACAPVTDIRPPPVIGANGQSLFCGHVLKT
jgi:hypothetical protein